MKKLLLPFLLAIALCHTISVHAQWLEIDPHFPDSLNFIAWGISVVDENIVWEQQVSKTIEELKAVAGVKSSYYRPPFGGITQKQIDFLGSKLDLVADF